MGKGSDKIVVRVGSVLLKEIEDDIARKFLNSSGEPPTLSSWVRKAIQEKLDHSKRSRKKSS